MEGSPARNKEVLETVIECECTVLHITDSHLFEDPNEVKNGVNPFTSLSAVLAEACAAKTPDVVVASGDNAHDPTLTTYRMFSDLVRSFHEGPFLVIPGNHDVWDCMQPVFELRPVEFKNWTIVPIDTHVEGRVSGEVSDANVLSLQRSLERAAEHVLVVGHHPLVDIGVAWLDAHQVRNAADILSILQMHSKVQAYICGHVHQESTKQHGRLKLWTTPSTCWQFESDIDSFALSPLAPGWRWLELRPDGTIATRVERLSMSEIAGVS